MKFNNIVAPYYRSPGERRWCHQTPDAVCDFFGAVCGAELKLDVTYAPSLEPDNMNLGAFSG